jgi:hypothetical protein
MWSDSLIASAIEIGKPTYMYLEHQAAAFDEFLAQNTSFWSEHGGAAVTGRCIYVDLAHDNPAYLLTNLWIAKYLQRRLGTRLVGLTVSSMKGAPHFDAVAVRRLAESFLVDEVRSIDDDAFEDAELAEAFIRAVEGLKGHALRQAVLSFASDVDPDIGWVLYDTWIRQEMIGSFDEPSPELIACARRLLRARRGTRAVMAERPIAASVVGHYHYSPYAWMAREAVANGAPAYFQSLLLPVSLRRFRTLEDFRRGRSVDFVQRYHEDVRSKLRDEQLDSFSRRMFDVQGGVRQFFRTMTQAATIDSRDDALRHLSLDPALPTVCIYVPALCGPPHCFGPLAFDDNGDWLKVSLGIATETPAVNFLVKVHPQDATYDVSGLVARCAATFGGHANIRFLDPDVPPNQVAAMCDLAVTVSGTPGYELAARGVPTLAAGPSRYSGLGFCIDATSLDTYRAWLSDPRKAVVSEADMRDALAFMFFEMSAARSQSIFLPAMRFIGTAEFWIEGTRRLRAGLPEEDALWRNLSYMLDADLPFLLNVDIVASDATPPPSRTSAEVGLAGLHALGLQGQRRLEHALRDAQQVVKGIDAERERTAVFMAALLGPERVLRFGAGQPGNVFLGQGWSAPEEGGIWTDGGIAGIELPSLPSGVVYVMECYGYATAESPERALLLQCNDGPRVAASLRLGEGPKEIRLPAGSSAGSTKFRIFVENPLVPEAGTRRLGLWLQAIRVQPAH